MAKKTRVMPIPRKPGQLRAVWGKVDRWDDPSIVYMWAYPCGRSDTRMLSFFIEDAKNIHGKTLKEELEARGYDITTLKFTCDMKSFAPTEEKENG